MEVFSYKAMSPDGTNVEGTVEAATEGAAIQSLSGQQYAVYEITPGNSPTRVAWYNRELFKGGYLTDAEVADLSKGLSGLLNRHIQLDEALSIASETASSVNIKHALARVRDQLLTGASVEVAFSTLSTVFPKEFLAMVQAGARSNTLNDTLMSTGTYYEQRAKAKKKLLAALAYPVFLLVAAIGVFLVILFTMVPALHTTILAAGQAPSGTLSAMYRLGLFLEGYWLGILVLCFGVLGGVLLFRKLIVDKLTLIIPTLRKTNANVFYARVARILYAQLSAKDTLDRALEDALEIVGESALSDELKSALQAVKSGEPAGPILLISNNTPDLFSRLFDLGERTDNLADLLLLIAQGLEEQYARTLAQITGLLTPALTLFVGGIITLLVQVLISAVLEVSQVAV